MIIDNSKFDCSLNDTTKLRKLIVENPDLPLLIFAGEEAWQGEYSYNQTDASVWGIKTLTFYNDMWLDEQDYEDRLYDDLCECAEYVDMSNKEYDKMIKQKVAETEFCKAIVIYVG